MSRLEHIPFNRAYGSGGEAAAVQEAINLGYLAADGPFTSRCEEWLQEWSGSRRVFLTPSCTAALEAAAILIDVGPGDEVIMPSYTFVSTANAFVLRGATPVFVDIRPDTLNIDETLVADAITPATKAIVPVHYGGIGCEIEPIAELADQHGISLVEDAAQGILAARKGRPLGSMGALGAVSFHETKDVTCGEGGALLVNDESLIERAEIVRDKGTDRKRFFRGQVDKYTWVDVGSSFGLSDLNAAFLWVQLQAASHIKRLRCEAWDSYHRAFEPLEEEGVLRRPVVPDDCDPNAHMYYLLLENQQVRDALIRKLRERNIDAVFHYIPLHSSPGGRQFGRTHGELANTDDLATRLVRLPLWAGMTPEHVDRVADGVRVGLLDMRAARST